MLQRYLLVWLVLSSAAAYFWPRLQIGDFDPFAGSKPVLPGLIVAAMFSIGLMLPRDELVQVIRRWPLVLGGTLVQYASMPLLAFAIGHASGLQGDHLIGVILVGCVPGAMASNVLTFNARGNTSYSVSLTTAATLASPLAVPLAMMLALRGQKTIELSFVSTSLNLLATVVTPVIAGHLIGRRVQNWRSTVDRAGTIAANLAILWIIAAVVGLNREPLSQITGTLFGVLIAINLAGYAAGFLAGTVMRLPDSMRRALTLEIGMQNAGLGAVLATQLFGERLEIAIAPAMYTFGCMLTGAVLSRYWSARTVLSESSADVQVAAVNADS